jgi:hypothetical protein
MTLEDRQTFLQLFFSGCLSITKKKGKDYNPTGVPFLEILETAVDAHVEPETVLYIYYRKHASAITAFLQKGHLESEPILGRLQDAANYMGMIAFYETEKFNIHAAWRTFWSGQPCACEYPVGMPPLTCQRCNTLSWMEKRAFALGSGKGSTGTTRKARG